MQAGTYKGLVLFTLILGIMLIISLAAIQTTGTMGIEERFTTALGLSHEHEEDEHHTEPESHESVHDDHDEELHVHEEHGHHHAEGPGGFLIEGNIPAYLLILGLLIVCSLLLWRRT